MVDGPVAERGVLTAPGPVAWFTFDCRSLARFEDQRAYLFGAGIPAAFLPSASELGRTDLT